MMNSLPLQTRQTLKALGFSENECKILLPLFAKQAITTKELSQQTTLSFETVHYALHSLEKKGLIVRTTRQNEDLVTMKSPKDFYDWIEEQKRVNSIVYDEAKSVLSSFLTTITEASWKPEVMYFEGIDGVKEIYEDMIREGKDIYGWRNIQDLYEVLGPYVDEYIEQRMKKKIHSYGILPEDKANAIYAKKEQMRHVKFSKNLEIDGEIRIYGNKVAVITLHEKKPVGFIFSGPVTKIFKGIFDQAWKDAT